MKNLRYWMAAAVVAAGTFAYALEDPTPEHVDTMKKLGSQMGQIRKGVDVEKNATDMAETMKKVGAFWKGRTSEVAMKTCKESLDGALAVAKAAKENDAAGVKSGLAMVNSGCKGCHDVHREKVGENLYKIK